MYSNVLVPLDGSEFAEHALPHAKTIARCGIEKVILMRVVAPIIKDVKDMIEADYVRRAERKREEDAQGYLDKKADELKKEGVPAETKLIVNGEPAYKILEYAREAKADLIIMSTHGRTGFKKWVFGSVANNVMVNSAIPVLMVVPEGTRK